MDARTGNDPASGKRTTLERVSDVEVVITRTINGPARLVFEAWTNATLFPRWWVPKSAGITLLSCEMDVRVGGGYRLVFAHEPEPMAFFGRYLEVVPPSRLVWTNDESGDQGAVSTVTFDERDGKTRVVLTERYPSKEACDAGLSSGAYDAMNETFDQLEAILPSLASR